jgi:hypothetical protein
MVNEPDNLVLEMLRGMRTDMATKADVASVRREMADNKTELKSDINSLRADLTSTRKELGEQIVGLRRAVVEYHSSTIGHGILISELEARMRRVEQHLNLPPLDTH